MHTTLGTALLILSMVLIVMAVYFLLRNWRHRKVWIACRRLFEILFSDVNGMQTSHQDRAKLANDPYGLVYGEITFEGFSNMLAMVQPKAEEVFYDLGAGSGKAVFCAALLYSWKKCCGIELLAGLHQLSLDQHNKLQNLLKTHPHPKSKPYPIQFIQSDFLVSDISDAGVIFINATCFMEDFWQKVLEKLDTVKAGTRIIIASKRLAEGQYRLLAAGMLPMSWGMNSAYIYLKTS
jgi:hypothetical protein